MEIIDISIALNEKTPVWEGDSGITITHTDLIEDGKDFNVSRLEMGVHAGTHIDAPFHFFSDRETVDQIDLSVLIGPVHVLEIPENVLLIEPEHLNQSGYIGTEERILLKTDNSKIWESDPYSFNKKFAALSDSSAELFVKNNQRLVGIDYFSISPFNNLKPPHEILLKSGIVILENANLQNVLPGFYDLYCLPLKLTGTDGTPVRAVLINNH